MGAAPGQRQVSGVSDSALSTETAGKIEGIVLAGAALLAPLLSIFAPLGMAPLLAVSAIALLAADVIVSRGLPGRTIHAFRTMPALHSFALAAGMLCIWMLTSATWSIAPRLTIENLVQVAGFLVSAVIILGGASRLPETGRRNVQIALSCGLGLALAIYIVERFAGAPIGHLLRSFSYENNEAVYSPYNRGLSVFMLMAFALIVGLVHEPGRLLTRKLGVWAAGAGLAIVVILTWLYFGSSLVVASIAAVGAVILGLLMPRIAPWIIGVLMTLYVMAAPFLPPIFVPRLDIIAISEATRGVSISHRLVIWQFSAERIAEKPLAGWGMNSARVMPGAKETTTLSYANGFPSARGERLPLHTHNAALQWWLELGAVGAVLALSLWLIALTAAARYLRGRAARAAAFGGLIGAFTIANLSYGAWQSWWIASLLFAAAFILLSTTPGRSNA